MSDWTASYGCGNGGFGQVPWGLGPYPTFPHSPGYGYTQDMSFPVEIMEFEDRTEQRILHSRERAVSMDYAFPHISQAEASDVVSFYLWSGGPLRPVVMLEHRTQRPYIARFGETMGLRRTAPVQRDMPRVGFTAVRPVSYPEEVYKDGPVGYWRLTDAPVVRDVSSAHLQTAVYSTTAIVRKAVRDVPLLPEGFDRHSYIGSGAWVEVPSHRAHAMPLAHDISIEGIFTAQNTNVGQWLLLKWQAAPFCFYGVQVTDATGRLTWTISCESTPAQVFVAGPIVTDGEPHHFVARRKALVDPKWMDLWVDGVFCGSVADAQVGVLGVLGGLLNLGGWSITSPALASFYGVVGEIAVYSSILPEDRFTAHLRAWRGD